MASLGRGTERQRRSSHRAYFYQSIFVIFYQEITIVGLSPQDNTPLAVPDEQFMRCFCFLARLRKCFCRNNEEALLGRVSADLMISRYSFYATRIFRFIAPSSNVIPTTAKILLIYCYLQVTYLSISIKYLIYFV